VLNLNCYKTISTSRRGRADLPSDAVDELAIQLPKRTLDVWVV